VAKEVSWSLAKKDSDIPQMSDSMEEVGGSIEEEERARLFCPERAGAICVFRGP